MDRVPTQLTAIASAGPEAGEVYDTATLSGGLSPTGTVSFALFGPNDPTCARPPVFTSVKPVNGGGVAPVTVDSDHAFLATEGVYHFVASYSGDALHAPAGPTACADPSQAIGFASSSIAFYAEASPATTVGGRLWDTATIVTDSVPTGTITFSLFGPDRTGCEGAPVFTSARPVNGSGSYRSARYTPAQPGVYRWVASYSGDHDDPSLRLACDDPTQRVNVAAAAPVLAGGPCAVLAQRLRGLGPWAPPQLQQALQSAWSRRLGCG